MSHSVSILWSVSAGALVLYLAAFLLTGRSVALRPRRVAVVALAIAAARLWLLARDHDLTDAKDVSAAALCALLALLIVSGSSLLLVRATGAQIRDQLAGACARLFLKCEESRTGRYVLSARGDTRLLRIFSLGSRTQLAVLPSRRRPGKISLLVRWFSNQYPGLLPRPRIVLKGGRDAKKN